jgi:hypothetical protein
MLPFYSYKDLIVFIYILVYYSKKVKILLLLNYKALYTLRKGRCNLRTNIYLLSFIIFVFSIKIVSFF